jgi:chaperonin GroES
MRLKPLFDKVVVKEVKAEETTKNGIFLPSAAKDKQEIAIVVAVGAGGNVDGKDVTMIVKVGDKVLYSKYAGSEFTVDEEKVTIIRQSDILAIVD